MITCRRCGHANAPDREFCTACDAYLEWHAAGPGEPARARGSELPRSGAGSEGSFRQQLAECLRRAHTQGRHDLVARLESARRAVTEPDLPVVVVGEFKQGKSSLVNALVKSAVCPVDDDVVTAVPTVVRYGERPEALVHRANLFTDTPGARADDEPPPSRIALDQIATYVRGEADPGDDGVEAACRTRSVEVRLDRRILRSGLSFVDCPGLGGLESAEGSVALGMLTLAEAVLFVTDAAQELTRAELTFLQAALRRCPRVVCVVSKIDLHPEWRRIVELNQGHLAAHGLD
ncbi:MAG TPA: dynamin family protein, partial [Acidimicrobiales bacterium]